MNSCEKKMLTSLISKVNRAALFAGVVLAASVATASARVSMVNCEGYIVSIADEDTLRIQERVGSGEAYLNAVCAGADQLPLDEYKTPTRVNVRLEPIDYHLTVVIIPLLPDNSKG